MSLIAKPTTKSTELLDKRQESSKTFDNQDNTFTVVSVLGPVHYKETYAENEDWLDIDPTHVVETLEYTFYDQMPIKVKVFKNKIGYEVEDRETAHKITVELDQIKPEGITFETKIHPCRIRLWKTIKSGSALTKLRWKITEVGKGKLTFREKPESIDASGNEAELTTTKTLTKDGFIWEEELTGKVYQKQTPLEKLQSVEKTEAIVAYPIKIDTDVDVSVAASGDDGMWSYFVPIGGSFDNSNTELFVAWCGNYAGAGNFWYKSFMRFLGITIPQGSTLTKGNLVLDNVAQQVGLGAWCKTKIYGDDQNNPSAPTTYDLAQAITPTTTQLDWDPTTAGDKTIDIMTILQELVTSYDYSNEAMQICIKYDETDAGTTAYGDQWSSWDHATDPPPALSITYGGGAAGPTKVGWKTLLGVGQG